MTLWAGIWPPSPGFDPCATLIWSSSADAAYSAVTPKRPGGDLLDLRVALVAVASGVLAALPGVRAPAEPVERDRDGLVRLGRERAVRHRAAGEPPHDRVDRLDLLERDRLPRGDELEQVARLHRRSPVDEVGEARVELLSLSFDGLDERVRRGDALLERLDDVRIGRVRLAALAELVEARVLERRLLRRARLEPRERVAFERVERDAADRRRRAAEEPLAEPPVEPHRFEETRAAVARDVGDADLRHHLQHAVLERAQETCLCLGGCRPVAADLVCVRQPRDGLERQTRADDVGAVADERRDHVCVPGVVGRDEQRARRPQPALHEPAVRRGNGEERGHGRPLAPRRSVGETEHGGAGLGEGDGPVCDPLDRGAEPLGRGEGRVDLVRPECREAVRRDEERGQDGERRQRALRVERRASADEGRDGHDRPFAVVIDRGVRHLCEALPEVRRKRPPPSRERRDRGVVAHRVDGVLTRLRDWPQHERELFARVAVKHVTRAEVALRRRERLALLREAHALVYPGGVGLARGELALELAVEEQAAPWVERQELAGAEPGATDGDALRQRDRAGLGRHGDEAVVAHGHAQRAQPVPVERRAADHAVREHEPGGPVPGLGQHRVEAMHRALPLVDPRVVLPSRRHEQREGLADVEPGTDEQLERVVEERRVGTRRVEGGREIGIDTPSALARLHPGDVPVDGVDLAVVAEEAERLRALPARLGVRGEPLVEDRPRCRPRRVGEVGVEAREVRGRAERLVRHRPEGERCDVDALHALRPAARTVRAELGIGLRAGREHELGDPRHARGRRRSERGDVGRHVAPAERLEPLGPARLLDDAAQPRLAQEAHREPGALDPRQGLLQRQEQPRAVTRDAVGGPRAPVRDRREAGQSPVDQLARRAATRIGDEADAAGVSLDCRVVEGVAHVGCDRLSWVGVEVRSRRLSAASWRRRVVAG